ncbi:MAG: AAA family ATPase [Lentisphaeraceae bacterium]|nr:AAA family ATPase [Lentisphaeraceae bacterium]
MLEARPYLKKIELLRNEIPDSSLYPFNLPIISQLDSLDFHKDVTFIIGENGSGKSTLIEAIATSWGFNAEGGNKNFNFETEETHSNLKDFINIQKSFARPQDGFFLRAESYYNVASYVDTIPDALESMGGKSLHHQSHGESFMTLLTKKLRGKGLYIFDEPEAALSPTRQIEALACIQRLVSRESQFIIATHSPILLSFPDAIIYQINNGKLEQVEYTETEHYKVTKNFLNRYEKPKGIDINSIFD